MHVSSQVEVFTKLVRLGQESKTTVFLCCVLLSGCVLIPAQGAVEVVATCIFPWLLINTNMEGIERIATTEFRVSCRQS